MSVEAPEVPTISPESASAVEEAKARFARATGQKSEGIRTHIADWSRLLEMGGSVAPHVGAIRGKSSLTFEDYGWDEKALTKEQKAQISNIMTFGDGYYLPKKSVVEKRDSIESKFRNTTRTMAYPMKGHFGEYFMPEGRPQCFLCEGKPLLLAPLVDHLQAEHPDLYCEPNPDDPSEFFTEPNKDNLPTELRPRTSDYGREQGWHFRRWLAEAERLKAEYDRLGDWVFENWDDLIAQQRLETRLLGFQNYQRLLDAGRRDLGDVEEWVGKFVDRRMAKAPSRETFREAWYLRWTVTYHPLQLLMAQDSAAAQKTRDDANAYSIMSRAKAASVKSEIEDGVKKFAGELQAHLSNLMYDAMLSGLEAIRNNGAVPGATVRSLRRLYQQLQDLQIVPDETMDRQLADLQNILGGGALVDRTKEVRNTMRLLAAESRLILMELGETPDRSGREVSVPDTLPALRIVTSGRRSEPVSLTPIVIQPVSVGRDSAND